MILVTCQSLIVKQIKENDGYAWPCDDQSHNQQPGHRWSKGQNDIIQKCPMIRPRWRGRLPAVALAAHWWKELGSGRKRQRFELKYEDIITKKEDSKKHAIALSVDRER